MVDFIVSFKAFIEKIVKMIQDFVQKIRDMNDGKTPEETEGSVA